MVKKFLGKRIRTARKECGMTAEKLSEICSINTIYLRQIEGGIKLPSLSVFIQLCNALNVSSDYLLFDVLTQNELSDLGSISKLFISATPLQIRFILAIIKAALDHMARFQ